VAKFKTRARTIDMLGRQQIAGIPTAISELFKNAHDAYAKRVEVDYFRSNGLFVLRDDGLGMTREDFEKRWLTIGTESKLDSKVGIVPPPIDPDQLRRPILGEKGIGRLAIASIGPQLLVLTRAKRDNGIDEIIAAYIHWGIFESPGINLDDIEIPIRVYKGSQLPTKVEIAEMLSEFKQNLVRLKKSMDTAEIDSIERDLELFNVDPIAIDKFLGTPSLIADEHGTHFIILPASELLQADIDGSDTDNAAPLQKALLGFTNTMTPNHEEPVIKAAFRDHKTNDLCDDLINEREFFLPSEFTNADHHIRGQFDDFGQFRGKVSIYGEEYIDHVIPWSGGSGRPTYCGPFKINVATVQGAASQSTIPLEDWGRLVNKMNKIGGLYIYKDGIRILPYGDTDYDWIDIEKNRTKGAAYYYFSYRRIFGVVEINQKDNAQLKEKAGREGFIENRAYRQLKSILKNFFIQMAADFFRDQSSPYSERFIKFKANLDRLEQARRKREQLVSVRRKKLSDELIQFFLSYDAGKPQDEALKLTEGISEQLENATKIDDPKIAADRFLQIEGIARQQLSELQERYKIVRPRGVGLSQAQEREWANYMEAFGKLQQSVFAPAIALVEDVVSTEAQKARLGLDRRLRVESALNEISSTTRKVTRNESAETRQVLTTVQNEITAATQQSLAEIEVVLKDVFAEFARMDVSQMEDKDVVDTRIKLETRIVDVKEREQQFFQYIRAQLEAIDLTEKSGQFDQMEALEQRALILEEEADKDLQLAQLGMAIEVINHEFNLNVKTIRKGLDSLGAWADLNQGIRGLYGTLRTSFDHLDGYLTLFSPLDRRLHRNKVEIQGSDINKFLQSLFSERLHNNEVTIQPTRPFLKKILVEYPSSIYPVFINLIDNSLFWLQDQPKPRLIKLDADDSSLIISDNGPGIAERDREAIFELGFTRKPGGRGMGLHISREVLKKIGYTLTLDDAISQRGATFRIQLPDKEDTGEQEF